MKVRERSAQPSTRGSSSLFTGAVWIDYLHESIRPSRVQIQHATFEPGSRTVWHTHPLGQVLIVTAGQGWAQSEGQPVTRIRVGDVISFAPGEKHWHGATRDHVMSFLAIQEELDGSVVAALERVSEDEYSAGNSPPV